MSCGLSYRDALRFPKTKIPRLWKARESRLSRESLRLMDDMLAIGGLESETRDKSSKKKKKSTIEPVGYNRHWEQRMREGYPRRTVPGSPIPVDRSDDAERRRQERFTRDLDVGHTGFVRLDLSNFRVSNEGER